MRTEARLGDAGAVDVGKATAVEWLLSAQEPAVRHLTRRDLLGQDSARDRADITTGPVGVSNCLPGSGKTADSEATPTASGPGHIGGWCRWQSST